MTPNYFEHFQKMTITDFQSLSQEEMQKLAIFLIKICLKTMCETNYRVLFLEQEKLETVFPEFRNKECMNTWAAVDTKRKILCITNELLTTSRKTTVSKMLIIFHEIGHILQEGLIDSKTHPLAEYLKSEFTLCETDYPTYLKCYQNLLMEQQADLFAHAIGYYFLNIIHPKLFDIYTDLFFQKISELKENIEKQTKLILQKK